MQDKKKGATQAPFFISTLPAGLADLVIENDARAFFATRQQAKKTFFARLGQHLKKRPHPKDAASLTGRKCPRPEDMGQADEFRLAEKH
jgi:hypothetical protein